MTWAVGGGTLRYRWHYWWAEYIYIQRTAKRMLFDKKRASLSWFISGFREEALEYGIVVFCPMRCNSANTPHFHRVSASQA